MFPHIRLYHFFVEKKRVSFINIVVPRRKQKVSLHPLRAQGEGLPMGGYRTGLMFRFTPRVSSLSTMVQLLPG